MKPLFIMSHFPQQYNISEFNVLLPADLVLFWYQIWYFGYFLVQIWNIDFHRALKLFYDMLFDLFHVHTNKKNQVKSVLISTHFWKGFVWGKLFQK